MGNKKFMLIQPLKTPWKIDENKFQSAYEQVKERCDSEDNLTWSLGFPIIRSTDISGRLGKPLVV